MSAADVLLLIAAMAAAQAVPQPFPGARTPAGQSVQSPSPAATAPAPQTPPVAAPAAPAGATQGPGEAELGVPIYPGAQFITSYDAGQGQRYYLFGSAASFEQLVSYYRTVLKTRGDLVFDQPATHMFETGRFREESMAFPPSVTIKDYLWGGRGGYLNPVPGAEPQRFPTIIQIVPPPR